MIALSADMGGTRIKLALVENQVVLAQETIEAHSDEGLVSQLPRISEAAQRLCVTVGIGYRDCGGVGVGFPSLVDDRNPPRILTSYGKYHDAPQVNLSKWAREEFGLPLMIENDARLALLGEWKAGAGRGSNDVVMVTLGTGLGTAAVIQGDLLRGAHRQSGVLGGHLTVRIGGRRCTCGNRGCAEAEASTSVLPEIASTHAAFLQSGLRQAHKIDYATVFRFAREGDACAMDLRAEAIAVWSALIVNLIHSYDPDTVIIGGGIAAGRADFLPDLERTVHEHAHTPWGHVNIVLGQLGDSAALIGGEALVRERLGTHANG